MKNIKILSRIFMVSTVVFALGSCKDDFTSPPPPTGTPLATVASTNDNFNILTAALNKTALFNSLNNNNSGQFTVFSPSDAAFIVYFKTFNAALVTEADVLAFVNALTVSSTPSIATVAGVLNYHIMSSKLTSDLITGNQVFATLNGARLSISKSGTIVVLNANSATNGAAVTAVDVLASNGVIHTIDRVMAAVANANILTPFGLTVSYATNPATVGGGNSPDATGTDFDLMAGLIRITGQAPVLLPNQTPLPDFTVFTPTDAAMIAYFSGIDGTLTTEALIMTYMNSLITVPPGAAKPNLELPKLTDIAKYHILPGVPPLPGRYLTSDFTNGQALTTQLTAKTITVNITGVDPAFTYTLVDVNALNVDPIITTKNVLTNSGIQHIMNGVLLPN